MTMRKLTNWILTAALLLPVAAHAIKISELPALGTTPADGDLFVAVDVSDPNEAVSGTTKKVTYSELGIGSGGSGAPAKVLIEEITLTSGAPGEFDFDSIPQTYDRLIIEGNVRGDVAAIADGVYMLYNSDTTDSNYYRQNAFVASGSQSATTSNAPVAMISPAGSSPSAAYTSVRIVVEDYAGGNKKNSISTFVFHSDTSSVYAGNVGAVWTGTDAITRIRIRTDNDPTDQLYGTLRLYGERSITAEASETITVKQLVDTQTLTSGAPGKFDFDFTNYQDGDRIIIEGYVRGGVSSNYENVYSLLNNDTTTTNYYTQPNSAYNNGASNGESNSPVALGIPGGTALGSSYAHFTMVIENYAASSHVKLINSFWGTVYANGEATSGQSVVKSAITGPVTRVTLTSDNDPTDQLYGIVTAEIEKQGVLPVTGYTQSIVLDVGDETTALTTGTAKKTFRMPYAFTLTGVRASVTTAPTDAALQVDINEGGTSILSTVLSIDSTEKTSTTAATPAVISDASLADDAEITIDIDQIGSTVAGAGLKVVLIGNR